MTLRLPACWCRPSTFWVTSDWIRPACSSAASAWWAGLAAAAANRGQPTTLRAQYRRRVSALPVKAWKVTGWARFQLPSRSR